jgi:hypothetical protein
MRITVSIGGVEDFHSPRRLGKSDDGRRRCRSTLVKESPFSEEQKSNRCRCSALAGRGKAEAYAPSD